MTYRRHDGQPVTATCCYCGAPISVPERTCEAHSDLLDLEADMLSGWPTEDYRERTRA